MGGSLRVAQARRDGSTHSRDVPTWPARTTASSSRKCAGQPSRNYAAIRPRSTNVRRSSRTPYGRGPRCRPPSSGHRRRSRPASWGPPSRSRGTGRRLRVSQGLGRGVEHPHRAHHRFHGRVKAVLRTEHMGEEQGIADLRWQRLAVDKRLGRHDHRATVGRDAPGSIARSSCDSCRGSGRSSPSAGASGSAASRNWRH